MAYTREYLTSRTLMRSVIHQPADAATAQLVDLGQPQGASAKMLPIAEYRRVLVQITSSLLVGAGPTAFAIYAGTSAAGANPTSVVAHAVGTAPDAEGDTLYLECDVQQIQAALANATHVGVWLDCANNDDEVAVTVILADPMYPRAGLTADYTAA
jgi:hypothetical protein